MKSEQEGLSVVEGGRLITWRIVEKIENIDDGGELISESKPEPNRDLNL